MQELESILRNDSLMASVQEDFGNMTCFIEIYKQGKLVKRFSWPEGNGPDNKVVDRLNKVLGSLEKTPEN